MSIEIKNLTYTYNAGTAFEKKALDDVSLTIDKGSFVGLIGHTGSGKSTLIQHINALLKPTSGQVLIDGRDIHSDKSKLKEIRQKVGLVFQYPEHQLFEMTVFQDVAFGPSNMGFNKEDIEERVISALDIVGIGKDTYEKSPFELSGGQKRRTAIAGVLAMKPEVLILDEPTAGLDPRGRDEILAKIHEMHKKLNITVILVSHSMEDIAKLVDSIIVMNNGTIHFSGTPTEVFSHAEELEKIGLAAPSITYLMHALNKNGFDVPQDIYTVDAATEALYKILVNRTR